MIKDRLYKLRYGMLDPNIIFNEIGPFSGGKPGWSEEAVKLREEKGLKHIKFINEQTGFFDKLEESILKDGFRNPILVSAGWCAKIRDRAKNVRLPLEMQNDHSKILTCPQNGGSRLYIAQKHNLKIPCIVSDYVDRFPELELLETRDDILEQYIDKPEKIVIEKDMFRIYHLPQAS